MLEYKADPVAGLAVEDEGNGVVSAIVSVTGVKDNVDDIIHPGAYQKTLKSRLPKGVWHHKWDQPVSRTLEARELLPGDAELPKQLPDGKPWPAEAGGLLVKTEFNMRTQRGRDAYEDVKFFGDGQQWSVGFVIPEGKAKKDPKTGVRHIKELDLFEYSPVLVGAMPLTVTRSVKSAQEAMRAVAELGAMHAEDDYAAPLGDDAEDAPAAAGDEPGDAEDAPADLGEAPTDTTQQDTPAGGGGDAAREGKTDDEPLFFDPQPEVKAIDPNDDGQVADLISQVVADLAELEKWLRMKQEHRDATDTPANDAPVEPVEDDATADVDAGPDGPDADYTSLTAAVDAVTARVDLDDATVEELRRTAEDFDAADGDDAKDVAVGAFLDVLEETVATVTGDGRNELRVLAQVVADLLPSGGQAASGGEKRSGERTEAERRRMAEDGEALDDGSYPIGNVAELRRAVQAYGRARDKAKAKRHIIARARALNAVSELPDDWDVTKGDPAEGMVRVDLTQLDALRATAGL